MDALFFTRRSEDHATLARAIANLDPAAFRSLANAMQTIAANADGSRTAGVSLAPSTSPAHAQSAANSGTASESQLAFLHAANAAAVEGVAAIEAQVERLLPEGVAKNACTRVVDEIYRELDSSLRSNPQFAAQLRDAFRSGVAKRVLSEWTSTP